MAVVLKTGEFCPTDGEILPDTCISRELAISSGMDYVLQV